MALLLLLLHLFYPQVEVYESTVIGVQDGDTIELREVYDGEEAGPRDGKNLRIRFAHINCPEKNMPFYMNAKNYTSKACFGKTVKIIHKHEFDRFGRLIGEVVLPNGQILNQELVKNGLAIHFKKYSKSNLYANLEQHAKELRLGIWSQEY